MRVWDRPLETSEERRAEARAEYRRLIEVGQAKDGLYPPGVVIPGVSRADGYGGELPVTGRRGQVPPALQGDLGVRVARACVFLAAQARQRLEDRASLRVRFREWGLWLVADAHVQDAIDRLEDAKVLAAVRLGLMGAGR